MAGYISLIKFTPQGAANIKNAPGHMKGSREFAAELGIKIIGYWITMGEYDLVSVLDAPDDQAVAQFMLACCAVGDISTQTMRAFSEDEFAEIVAKLP